MGFQSPGMKRKTSFSVCSVHRQWKNSAPLCGSCCDTTRRICTDGVLWNGRYSEWLDPFVLLLIERGHFFFDESRMNWWRRQLETKTTLVSTFITAEVLLCLRVAKSAQRQALESRRACVAPIAHVFCVRGGYLSTSFKGGGQTIGFRAMRRACRILGPSLSMQGLPYERSTKEWDLHLLQDWISIGAHIHKTYARQWGS